MTITISDLYKTLITIEEDIKLIKQHLIKVKDASDKKFIVQSKRDRILPQWVEKVKEDGSIRLTYKRANVKLFTEERAHLIKKKLNDYYEYGTVTIIEQQGETK